MTGDRPRDGRRTWDARRDATDGADEDRARQRRLFVAVPVPPEARDAVAAVVAALPQDPAARPVRWVRLDALHVTLRFLGPTPEEAVPAVRAAVDRAAPAVGPFDVELGKAGAFPVHGRPRTLWLGVTSGGSELGQLVAALDDQLVTAGWPRDDRPFRGHLTLARADGIRAGAAVAAALIRATEGLAIRFVADRVTLFESLTGGGPARYEPLHEVRLAT